MQFFQASPFDEFILQLWESVLNKPGSKPLNSLGWLIFSHIKILRVIYTSYSFLEHTWQNPKSSSHNVLEGKEKLLQLSYSGTKTAIDYYSLINELNQLGRGLKKLKSNIPKYKEIYFFRNKVTEHWDDYTSYKPAGSTLGFSNRLPVPLLLGKRSNVKESAIIKEALIDEFRKYNVLLVLPEEAWYEDFADIIFPALKQIDYKLRSEKKNKPSIPNSIVKLLFQYEFPLPIYNIESYCLQLVNFFKKLQLTQ